MSNMTFPSTEGKKSTWADMVCRTQKEAPVAVKSVAVKPVTPVTVKSVKPRKPTTRELREKARQKHLRRVQKDSVYRQELRSVAFKMAEDLKAAGKVEEGDELFKRTLSDEDWDNTTQKCRETQISPSDWSVSSSEEEEELSVPTVRELRQTIEDRRLLEIRMEQEYADYKAQYFKGQFDEADELYSLGKTKDSENLYRETLFAEADFEREEDRRERQVW